MATQPMDRQGHDLPPVRSPGNASQRSTTADQQPSGASPTCQASAGDPTDALLRSLHQVLHAQDRGANVGRVADPLWSHQQLGALRDRADHSSPSIDGPGLLVLARQYCGQPGLHSDKIDWILMDAAVFQELDARDVDLLRYRRAAMLHYALKLMFVYVGLPLLAYLWFVADGVPVPASWLAGWGVVVVLHGLGAPFRWRDLRRARQLRERYRDLYKLLDRRDLSPDRLLSVLRQAAAEGVVLDHSIYALVAGLARGADRPAGAGPSWSMASAVAGGAGPAPG